MPRELTARSTTLSTTPCARHTCTRPANCHSPFRKGLVWVVLGHHAFDDDPSGFRDLLSRWGGEGISFTKIGEEIAPLLRRLGRPTIVVASIPVMPHDSDQSCTPGLALALVHASRGRRGSASIAHTRPILAQDVLHFWQPGDSEYDRFADLPAQ